MFRSGTTLLARMLNTHDDIACASDPFRPYFNLYRSDVAADVGVSVDPYDPINAYFADETQLSVYKQIQEGQLDRSFPEPERERLLDKILSHGRPFSDNLMDRLEANWDKIHGESYEEVYDELFSYIPEVYGTGTESWAGSKEVWTTEFTPVLADAYPDKKFFFVIRDPRGTVASKNAQESTKYPWLFLIQHWRKLSALSWLYDTYAPFSDRVHIVKYERLVQSPRETAQEMCEFLDIPLDESILDPTNFLDGSGDPWIQNTSHSEKKRSFNTNSVDKWQSVLNDRTVEFVEQLTFSEMELFGYERQEATTHRLDEKFVADPPIVPDSELADWIQSYFSDWTPLTHRKAVGNEIVRQSLLNVPEPATDPAVIEPYFLDTRYYEDARAALDS
jgi:hypothetical protein